MVEALPFTLVRGRRRTIAIHVDRSGQVEVRAPHWVAKRDILAFVTEKQSWIQRQQAKMASRPPFEEPRFCHKGEVRRLGEVVQVWLGPSDEPGIDPDRPPVMLRRLSKDASVASVQAAWRRLVRRELLALVSVRVDHWLAHPALAGLRVSGITIRRMTSRWGSCRRSGVLTFSEALYKYPRECIDAVIVHELCHLRHFNHGPEFHSLMDRVLPEWRIADEQLTLLARRY